MYIMLINGLMMAPSVAVSIWWIGGWFFFIRERSSRPRSLATSTWACLTIVTGALDACSTACDTGPSSALRNAPMPLAPRMMASQPWRSAISINVDAGSPEPISRSKGTPASLSSDCAPSNARATQRRQ